jgi:hypothetical protein
MGSPIEELKRREAAARAEADRLRSRIWELEQDLAKGRGASPCALDTKLQRLLLGRQPGQPAGE